MNPTQPWNTLKQALANNNDSDNSLFGSFSASCYYFGQSLSDQLAAESSNGKSYPIGLVHTAWGGSTIEQWLTNSSIDSCEKTVVNADSQKWHDQRVLPYVDMTLKGWVWYQGLEYMHVDVPLSTLFIHLYVNTCVCSQFSLLIKSN